MGNKKSNSKKENIKIIGKNNSLKEETPTSVFKNMKENVKDILNSNRESIENTYKIFSKELDILNDKDDLYKFCATVKKDCEKALEDENLTKEERDEILDREMKILEILSEQEKYIKEASMEITKMQNDKDSENKKFLWAVLGATTTVLLTAIGAKYGGKFLNNK